MLKNILLPAAGAAAGFCCTKAAAKNLKGPHWERTSFSGGSVSLTEGVAAVGAVLAGNIFAGGKKLRRGALSATCAAAAAGWIDDRCENKFAARGKGFRGHLGALKNGEITSGLLKILIIGSGSLCASRIIRENGGSRVGRISDTAVNTVVTAGMANLLNLFDLRPGRSLKVAAALSALTLPGRGRGIGSAVLGSAVCLLPDDLAGKTMLGDLGANALGASLGVALSASRSRTLRLLSLSGITALTLLSEKVSFSRVIEDSEILSALDRLGRSDYAPGS